MAQSRKRAEFDLTPVEQVANTVAIALNAAACGLHRVANFVEDHSGLQCAHHPAGRLDNMLTRVACGLCWDERQNEKNTRSKERANAL